MTPAVSFTLNGKPTRVESDPGRMLLGVLRSDLRLGRSGSVCRDGLCGGCAVLVDGAAHRACELRLGSVAGKRVLTVGALVAEKRLCPSGAARPPRRG